MSTVTAPQTASTPTRSATPPASPSTAGDQLRIAVSLAERGFAVFPLRPGTKIPAVREDWEGLAVRDPQRLRELGWPPGGNIGIACGPSGLFVLDLDVPKQSRDPRRETVPAAEQAEEPPRDGMAALRQLAAGRPIPRTFTVATPSGGRHLYYRTPPGLRLRNTVARLGPLIDTRAVGGYVVAPGSVIRGRPYVVVDDSPIAPVPHWIVRELAARTRVASQLQPPMDRPGVAGSRMSGAAAAAYGAAALRNEVERMLAARTGTRNDTLNRAAYSLGRLVGAGLLDRDLAASELFHAARRTGLPARECAATLASGLGAGIARPRMPARRQPAGPQPARRLPAESQHSASAPAPASPPTRRRRASGDAAALDALRAVDQAYDAVAVRAATLVLSQDWRRIRSLMDALRDLRDAPRLTRARRRHAASLCAAVGELAAALERATRSPARPTAGRGRSRSPLGDALRDLGRAADAGADALAGPSVLPGARRGTEERGAA